jgi:hypothetical protein
MTWRLELLAAAEPDEERRAELLRVADELREVLDALGMPADVVALLADFGIPEPGSE